MDPTPRGYQSLDRIVSVSCGHINTKMPFSRKLCTIACAAPLLSPAHKTANRCPDSQTNAYAHNGVADGSANCRTNSNAYSDSCPEESVLRPATAATTPLPLIFFDIHGVLHLSIAGNEDGSHPWFWVRYVPYCLRHSMLQEHPPRTRTVLASRPQKEDPSYAYPRIHRHVFQRGQGQRDRVA